MSTILKMWRHIGKLTPPIDAYSLEEQCAKFHPDRIWNDEALGFFGSGRPKNSKYKNKTKQKNKMSNDMGFKK